MKRLCRSEDTELAGVCTGIAKYYHVEPAIVQLMFILFTLSTGVLAGVIIYCVCVVVIPHENDKEK